FEFDPVPQAAPARRRVGPHLPQDEGAEFLGREARGGAAVAVALAADVESASEGRVFLGRALLLAFPAEPADLPAERLARPGRECADFAPGEFEPHRDAGPPEPEGAV